MSTLILRNPFAREELHRTQCYSTVRTCDFCGQTKSAKGEKRYLYSYHIETDGGRRHDVEGAFCSIGCMRAYHY